MFTLADVLNELAPISMAGALRDVAQGVELGGVCIDSRQARPRDLFVALRGERTDGHAYVSAAFQAGATVALVERPVEGVALLDTLGGETPAALSLPVAVRVAQSLQALQRLARSRRLAMAQGGMLRVMAVTGSVGKTTTKDAIAAVLSQRYRTLKSAGNYNNEIGLPLTLMSLEPTHERVVLEMGMYALGEIEALCRIAQPQVGVVTNVGPVHLERLGSIERIAQAKAELVESLPPEGVAVLNGDDARVRAMATRTAGHIVTFGLGEDNHIMAEGIASRGMEGMQFNVHVRAWDASVAALPSSYRLRLAALGSHSVMTALAAIAVGLVDGLNWEEIQSGLLAYGRGPRLQPKRALNGALLLDDTYNASPASNLAALDVLAELPGRHLAALGDMLELGEYEVEGHRLVGQRAAEVLDILVTVGTRARMIAAGAREAGLDTALIYMVEDNANAIALLKELLREGDRLLIKGSRGMGMEAIVQALAQE